MFVAELLFDGEQLFTCDEVFGSAESVRKLVEKIRPELEKAKKAKTGADEFMLEGKTCHEATSGRPWQAACKRQGDGYTIATVYYDSKALKGSDARMKGCLQNGGTWKVNDSDEAKTDALQREINAPEHQALRRRALQMLGDVQN